MVLLKGEDVLSKRKPSPSSPVRDKSNNKAQRAPSGFAIEGLWGLFLFHVVIRTNKIMKLVVATGIDLGHSVSVFLR